MNKQAGTIWVLKYSSSKSGTLGFQDAFVLSAILLTSTYTDTVLLPHMI